MPDLSIVLLPETAEAAGTMVTQVYAWTFMPQEVYLPMPAADLDRLRIRMPNFVPVPTAADAGPAARLDAALARAAGDYVAVVTPSVRFEMLWVEDALHAAMGGDGGTAFALQADDPSAPGFVLPTDVLARARREAAGASVADSLRAAGVALRRPEPHECALRFDRALQDAQRRQEEGSALQAAAIYRAIEEQLGNARWMRQRRAHALYEAGGRDAEALDLCCDLNRCQPTVDTLLLEARLHRRADRFEEAVGRLQHARRILAPKKGTPCN